jgi:NTE family protein
MTDAPLDPGRRAQLDPVLAAVFGDLDTAALAAIAQSVRWVSLTGGATLFRQGRPRRRRVRRRQRPAAHRDRRRRRRRARARGSRAAARRSASSRSDRRDARRERDRRYATATSLRLSKASFDALLERHPHAMMRIARAAAMRLRHTIAPARERQRAGHAGGRARRAVGALSRDVACAGRGARRRARRG